VAAASKVRIWDLASDAAGPSVRYPGAVRGLSWSPDSKRLAVSVGDGRVRFRSTVDVTRDVGRITVRDGPLGPIAWSPDGTRMATVGGHRTVQVWHVEGNWLTRRPVIRLRGAYLVRDVAWSPDGVRLAAVDADGKLWLWEVGGPDPADAVASRQVGDRPAIGLVWSPDGGLIAVARPDGVVSVHRPDDLDELGRVHLGAPARIDWAGPHLVAVVSNAIVTLTAVSR
jgi:WD40 repeat protein